MRALVRTVNAAVLALGFAVTEVVCGCVLGVDTVGWQWAEARGVGRYVLLSRYGPLWCCPLSTGQLSLPVRAARRTGCAWVNNRIAAVRHAQHGGATAHGRVRVAVDLKTGGVLSAC